MGDNTRSDLPYSTELSEPDHKDHASPGLTQKRPYKISAFVLEHFRKMKFDKKKIDVKDTPNKLRADVYVLSTTLLLEKYNDSKI